MKKNLNGVLVDMTVEEIEKINAEVIEVTPTDEERINALEDAFIELVGVIVNG